MSTISILLADSQHLTRLGLKHIIAEKKDLQVVHEAGNLREMVGILRKEKIDVVLVDYNAPGFMDFNTIDLLEEANNLSNLLIISSDNRRDQINKVLNFGIQGYLTKECSRDEIIEGIYSTAKGESFFCNKIIDLLVERESGNRQPENTCDPTSLSPRELEIIKLISDGKTTKEIAEMLFLSHHTINTHRKKILKKLELKTPTELVMYAVNSGIVTPNDPFI